MNWRRVQILFVAALMFLGGTAAKADDDVAQFYAGRHLRLVIGSPPGGSINQLIRTVGQHMVTHLPGKPSLVVNNMEGAGSRVAANWLYNIAPRDGSVIGNVTQGTALDQARKEPSIRFDVTHFNWIGNPLLVNDILLSWNASGLLTADDVIAKGGLVCGGSGSSSPSVINPQVLKNLTGADIKIILGYPGSNDRMVAVERGELNCISGMNMASARLLFPSQLDEHKLSVILQYGTVTDPDIDEYAGHAVPLISSFARNDADRKALDFIYSGIIFGRPLLAPPGVPEARVVALRQAFDATMRDPDFLADVAQQNMRVHPIDGDKLQRTAIEIAGTPDKVIERADELVAVTP